MPSQGSQSKNRSKKRKFGSKHINHDPQSESSRAVYGVTPFDKEKDKRED